MCRVSHDLACARADIVHQHCHVSFSNARGCGGQGWLELLRRVVWPVPCLDATYASATIALHASSMWGDGDGCMCHSADGPHGMAWPVPLQKVGTSQDGPVPVNNVQGCAGMPYAGRPLTISTLRVETITGSDSSGSRQHPFVLCSLQDAVSSVRLAVQGRAGRHVPSTVPWKCNFKLILSSSVAQNG